MGESEGRGGIPLKSEEKGGQKGGGGRGGVDAGKGSGHFWGEGSLIFILRVEEPP